MENDGIASLPPPSVSSPSVLSGDHGDQVDEERRTTDVWRGITERGERRTVRMDSRTNGALLLLLRRLVAGRTRPGGNITFRGGAQKP